MARIQVDPDTAAPVPCPVGIWGCIVTKCVVRERPEDAPFDPNDMEAVWYIRWNDPNLPIEVQGSMHIENTNVEPRKSLRFVRFAQALGFDPRDFDSDEVVDVEAKARVSHKYAKAKDGEPGEKRTFVRIDELMAP